MSLNVAYFYCIQGSEIESALVDLKVYKNQEIIKIFCLSENDKTKKIIAVIVFVGPMWVAIASFPAQPAEAMGQSFPQVVISKHVWVLSCCQFQAKSVIQVDSNVDKISITTHTKMLTIFYMNRNSDKKLLQKIKKLRSKDLSFNILLIFAGILIYVIYQYADGFTTNIRPGFSQPLSPPRKYPPFLDMVSLKPKPSPSSMNIHRPSDVPHEEFGSMSKSSRRQLMDYKDMTIQKEGHKRLCLGF